MRYNLLIVLIFFGLFPAMQWLVAHSSLVELYRQVWEWGYVSGFGIASSWM